MKEFPLPEGAGLAGGVPLPIEVPLPAEVQIVVVPADYQQVFCGLEQPDLLMKLEQ